MRKEIKRYRHNALPVKPQSCSLCHYVSKLGPNDMQLHLDREHKGWAERVIRKMDIRDTAPAAGSLTSEPPRK